MQGTEEPGQKQSVSRCSRRVQSRTIAATSRLPQQRSRRLLSAPSSPAVHGAKALRFNPAPTVYPPTTRFPAKCAGHTQCACCNFTGRELHLEVSVNILLPPAAYPPCRTRTPAATSAGTRQPPEILPLCGVKARGCCVCLPQAPSAHIVDLAVLHIRIYFIVTAAAAGAEARRAALAPRCPRAARPAAPGGYRREAPRGAGA